MQKIIKDDLEVRYSSASGEINLVMNIANFVDPRFKEDYLSEDELALVKEEIAVDIDIMDVMDHNSQGDRNKEQQQHQKDADAKSCEEQTSDERGYTEPPTKRLRSDKVKLGQIFKKVKEKKTSTPSTSGNMTVPEKLEFEMDYYVKSSIADPECDPLGWW